MEIQIFDKVSLVYVNTKNYNMPWKTLQPQPEHVGVCYPLY